MNPMTGKIQDYENSEELKKAIEAGFAVPVNPFEMTDKQKRDMQVSKHDSRSALGKLFGLNRARRRALMRKKKI